MHRLFFLLLSITAIPADDPLPQARRQEMLETFERQKKSVDAELEKTPDSVEWLTRRGDLRLFLGDATGAVADFEKEIKLDPAHDAPHWRLGIAFYFAGQYEKSAAQFAKYHAHDNRDRENGIWQFLANARVKGIDAARKEMLEYTRFDREPFPALYEMFAGRKTTAGMIAETEGKGLKDDALVMFFAHYYAGLNEELLGQSESARTHLSQAVALAMKARAEGGPGYMGQVARLHYEAAKKAEKPVASPPLKPKN